jgi:ATP-dependent helicase HrpA
VQEHLTTQEKLVLAQSPYRTTAALFEDCMVACIDAVVGSSEIYTRAEFEKARDAVSATIVDSLFQTVALVSRIIAKARQADKAIKDATSLALIAPLGDARSQLDALVYPNFVSATGLERLRRIPVYLDAIVHRVGKLVENPNRDRVWMTEVQLATGRYIEAGGALPLAPDSPPAITHARWMLEELRLSLFAQHIATAEPVSLQRITKVLATPR